MTIQQPNPQPEGNGFSYSTFVETTIAKLKLFDLAVVEVRAAGFGDKEPHVVIKELVEQIKRMNDPPEWSKWPGLHGGDYINEPYDPKGEGTDE